MQDLRRKNPKTNCPSHGGDMVVVMMHVAPCGGLKEPDYTDHDCLG